MEPGFIKQKLQNYFDGKTSLEDEQLLHDYFRSEKIEENLLPYRDLFSGLEEMAGKEEKINEDELMDFILETEHAEKKRYRQLWQVVTGIAAALIIALLVVNYNDTPRWRDTYSNPDQAYREAVKTLRFVAGKYQQGLGRLQSIGKINEAMTPMNKSLELLNKGFEKIDNINRTMNQDKNDLRQESGVLNPKAKTEAGKVNTN